MNTKGIKFLAVLTVMVMAFAAIVALAPVDNDAISVKVYDNSNVAVDQTVIEEETGGITAFYFSDDATVKVKSLAGPTKFYVQNGKELEINFRAADGVTSFSAITIYTVTADQQRVTTSTVDSAPTTPAQSEGKIVLEKTEVTFVGKNTQSVIYTAMMPYSVYTHTTSGDKIVTEVSTGYNEGYQQYATVSADDVLEATTIGNYVTVAYGQALMTTAPVGITYGIMTAILNEDDDEEITYYAAGMNAGSVVIAGDDEVIVLDGTITVSTDANNSTVKVTSATGDITMTTEDDKAITVEGELSTGTMTVSGGVIFDDFTDDATVTLNGSANVGTGSTMTVNGTLVLKNDEEKIANLAIDADGEGTIVAQNEKLWHYDVGATIPYIKFSGDSQNTFVGQFDVSAITKVAEVREAFSTAKIERNQTFRVVDDTVVTTSLDVLGVLIVEPGVTLTITKTNTIGAAITTYGQYSQIINNGEILIKTTSAAEASREAGLQVYGGFVQNNGKIIASSDSKTDTAVTLCVDFERAYPVAIGDVPRGGTGFVNEGTITVSKNDNVSLDDKFTNSKNGSVSINGTLAADALVNAGLFTLNNAKVIPDGEGKFTVTMKKGAEFNIVSVEVTESVEIIIQKLKTSGTVDSYISVKTPSVAGKYTVRGVDVKETGKLDLSGNVMIGVPAGVTEKAILSTSGKINVSSTATIGSGYDVKFAGKTTLNVTGDLTLSKGVVPATLTNLYMTVTGIVTTVEADSLEGCTYVAAKYKLPSLTTVYTTLEDAVPAAALLGVDMVAVGSDNANKSYVTVTEDVTIPAGMTVSGVVGGYLFVDEMATILVESTAMLNIDNVIILNGMIAAEDVNNIDFDGIVADVKTEDETSTAAACMSLQVALMLATEGDVIELSQTFFASDLDVLVIPEGVTVDATANEGTQFILVNSNLEINGSLVVDQFAFIATTDDTIGITVDGYVYDSCARGACIAGWWYTPFGVSYYITDEENDETWYVLTSIDNLQPAIDVADDAKVTVEGDAVLGDLTITGRDDMPAEVTFNGDLTAGEITIEDTTLVFLKGNEVTATVSDALGSITVIGAYAGDKTFSIYSMDDAGVYMAGTVTDAKTGTYTIMFEGITGIDGTSKAVIDWANYKSNGQFIATPTVLFAGETLATGKKVVINSDDENPCGMVTVTGLLVADNGTKLAINSDAQVLGGLVAAERSEDAVAGSIDMNGDLFVGTLKEDIYDYDDLEAAYAYHLNEEAEYRGYGQYAGELNAAAFISGKIDLVKAAADEKPFFITVLAGSEIDPAIVEDLAYVDIVIEDTLWITVYGYGDSDYSMDGLKAPIVNADVDMIVDAEGKEVADFSFIFKVIYNSKEKMLSEYGGVVGISLDYNVFSILIKTDGSVKAVYIDGILMYTGEDRNQFYLENVAAGTHKVTVEASTGYDADKCVLYTDMGTILPGMAFTFTEYDCKIVGELGYTAIYNINGTEIQPEPVPPTPEEESQWTITTILLVILVVLIAIMAVIVALRLNRS